MNEFNQGPIIDINSQDKLAVVNGSLEDAIIDANGDLLLLQGSIKNGTEYLLKRLGTTLSEEISRKLFTPEAVPRLPGGVISGMKAWYGPWMVLELSCRSP